MDACDKYIVSNMYKSTSILLDFNYASPELVRHKVF